MGGKGRNVLIVALQLRRLVQALLARLGREGAVVQAVGRRGHVLVQWIRAVAALVALGRRAGRERRDTEARVQLEHRRLHVAGGNAERQGLVRGHVAAREGQ